MERIIYLDNAATTSPNEEVLSVYNTACKQYFANPSSIHFLGAEASHILEATRNKIVSMLRMPNHDLIFTSGATEANNLAIKGYCLSHKNRGKHIITTSIEHASVLETIKELEKEGFEVTYLPVDQKGKINLSDFKNALRKETILVSVMAVNNEVGSIMPIETMASILKDYPTTVFHVDATQALGKVHINYQNVDMMSFSAHKLHGLKSSGALVYNKKITLQPIANGGGQEKNMRSGTNDLAIALALEKTIKNMNENWEDNYEKVSLINSKIRTYLESNPDLYMVNGCENPYIINFSTFKKASVVVEALSNKGIMVSSLSACSSKKEKYSYVIYNMFNDQERAHNTIRISLDSSNTMEDIEYFISSLDEIVRSIK